MSDLRTMEKRLSMDLRERWSFSSLTDEARAQAHLAIRDAIRSYESTEFWFNVGTFSVTTVLGQTDYSLASLIVTSPTPGVDEPTPLFLAVLGESLFMKIEGNAANQFELSRLMNQDWQAQHSIEQTVNNQPLYFDFWQRNLRLLPPPSTSTHVVYGRCLVDLGANVATWDGANWTFSAIDFTNAWFTVAEEMIRARAGYLFCKNYKQDVGRAMPFLERSLEKQAELQTNTNAKQARDGGGIEGYL